MDETIKEPMDNAAAGAGAEQSELERCLTFSSGGLTLFLSTRYVTEIINDCAITPIPLLPDYIKGILNLRGQILPVIDIRLYMGKPALEYTSKTCLIVLNIEEVPICIVVDAVCQVVDIDLSKIHPIPVKHAQRLLNGMVTMDDGSVLMSFDCPVLVFGQNRASET